MLQRIFRNGRHAGRTAGAGRHPDHRHPHDAPPHTGRAARRPAKDRRPAQRLCALGPARAPGLRHTHRLPLALPRPVPGGARVPRSHPGDAAVLPAARLGPDLDLLAPRPRGLGLDVLLGLELPPGAAQAHERVNLIIFYLAVTNSPWYHPVPLVPHQQPQLPSYPTSTTPTWQGPKRLLETRNDNGD